LLLQALTAAAFLAWARSIRRLSSRASSGRRRSGVPSRKASRPPLCSMVRMPLVDRRIFTGVPSTSDQNEVSCRLGRKRRRVLLLAWLTLLPVRTPLPVMPQRRAMAKIPME
jgi:hypothetical protein